MLGRLFQRRRSSDSSLPPDPPPAATPADEPREVHVSGGDAVYELEFGQAPIGLALETDFYGRYALVRGFRRLPDGSAAPAERCGLIRPGDALVGVNGELTVSLAFEDVMRKVRDAGVPVRYRFLRTEHESLPAFEEQLDAQRAAGRDLWGFQRDVGYLRAERDTRVQSLQRTQQRDLEWTALLKRVGGAQRLMRGPGQPGPDVADLVRRGVPVAFRGEVWQSLAGSRERAAQAPAGYYAALVERSATLEGRVLDDIEKDVDRTFPAHAVFETPAGRDLLRRCLRALAAHDPEVGYCQSMNFIVGTLLLLLDEEDAFWLFVTAAERLLPPDYFSKTLVGTHIDQRIFGQLIESNVPRVARQLAAMRVELPLITLQWFLCLFVNTLATEVALRVWDCFFLDGSRVLFRVAIALLRLREPELLAAADSGELFAVVRAIGDDVHDADALIAAAYERAPPLPFRRASFVDFDELDLDAWRARERPAVEAQYSEMAALREEWRTVSTPRRPPLGVDTSPEAVARAWDEDSGSDSEAVPSPVGSAVAGAAAAATDPDPESPVRLAAPPSPKATRTDTKRRRNRQRKRNRRRRSASTL